MTAAYIQECHVIIKSSIMSETPRHAAELQEETQSATIDR